MGSWAIGASVNEGLQLFRVEHKHKAASILDQPALAPRAQLTIHHDTGQPNTVRQALLGKAVIDPQRAICKIDLPVLLRQIHEPSKDPRLSAVKGKILERRASNPDLTAKKTSQLQRSFRVSFERRQKDASIQRKRVRRTIGDRVHPTKSVINGGDLPAIVAGLDHAMKQFAPILVVHRQLEPTGHNPEDVGPRLALLEERFPSSQMALSSMSRQIC